MRRLALGIVIVILAFSASGAAMLVIDEPCTALETSAVPDGACPPTCVTCGCCAQPTEIARVTVTLAPECARVSYAVLHLHVPDAEPGDILHVPKPSRL